MSESDYEEIILYKSLKSDIKFKPRSLPKHFKKKKLTKEQKIKNDKFVDDLIDGKINKYSLIQNIKEKSWGYHKPEMNIKLSPPVSYKLWDYETYLNYVKSFTHICNWSNSIYDIDKINICKPGKLMCVICWKEIEDIDYYKPIIPYITPEKMEEFRFTHNSENIDISGIHENNNDPDIYVTDKWYKDLNRDLYKKSQICTHNFICVDDIMICTFCHIEELIFLKDSEDKNPQAHMDIWRRDHDRGRWTNEMLLKLRGEGEEKFTLQQWYGILELIPETFEWIEVFKAFREWEMEDYWLVFGYFVDIPIRFNTEIIQWTEKYSNTFKGKYRFNYLYLLYKFTQIYGKPGDELYVPLKMSVTCLQSSDEAWKLICERDHIPFHISYKHKVTYPKTYIMSKLIESMKISNLIPIKYEPNMKKKK